MSAVGIYKLSQLDGMLNDHLGDLQKCFVIRHALRPSSDLKTFVSPKYQDWNITKGVTVYINRQAVITEETKVSFPSAVSEDLTYFDVDGDSYIEKRSLNIAGSLKFDKQLSVKDMVEADFSFLMKNRDELHKALFHGLLTLGRMIYQDLDPARIPAAFASMIVDASAFHVFEEMSSGASKFYSYAIEEQKHSKHQVADNLEKIKNGIDGRLKVACTQALWRFGSGRARQTVSIKTSYQSSDSLRLPNRGNW